MRKTLALLAILGLIAFPGWALAQSFEPDRPDDDATEGSEEEDEGDGVTFGEGASPAVGDTVKSTFGTLFQVTTAVAMDGTVFHESNSEQAESQSRTTEILRLDDEGEITQVRISVHTKESRAAENGEEFVDECQTVGKIYIATRDEDGGWSVEYCETCEQSAEGDSVPRFEASEIIEMAEGIDDGDNLRKTLAGNTYNEGDEVEISLADLLGQDEDEMEGLGEAELTVVFIGTGEHNGRRIAKFSVKMTMGGEIGPGMSMNIEAEGEMLVDMETLMALSMDLEGPIRIKGGDENMSIDGRGTFKVNGTTEFSRK